MTDASNGASQTAPAVTVPETRMPFPATRFLYSVLYGVIAYFVINLIFILALLQFVIVAINGRVNEELKNFSFSLVQYLWELFAYITFVRDEQPFPVNNFPKHA
jgi:hypothetical protein